MLIPTLSADDLKDDAPPPNGANGHNEPDSPEPEPDHQEAKPEQEKAEVKVSRRQAARNAREEMDKRLSDVQNELNEAKKWREELDKEKEGRIRLEATIEEMRRHVQDQQRGRQPEANAQAERMEKELARIDERMVDALDRKDWDTYRELRRQEAQVIAQHQTAEAVAKLQAQMPQQLPPWVAATEMKYANVAMHQAGKPTVKAMYDALIAQGKSDGPETFDLAYQHAERMLGLKKQPGPPERTRQALSGAPARSAGREGGDHINVRLPPDVMRRAKDLVEKGYMPSVEKYAEYWAEEHPEDVSE